MNFFTADYRDEFAAIAGRRFSAGSFVVQMLNIFYDNDTAQRISVFHDYRRKVQWCLEKDYLFPENLERAAEELDLIWLTLPRIVPFQWLDADAEKERYPNLLTVENGGLLRAITAYGVCMEIFRKLRPHWISVIHPTMTKTCSAKHKS